MKWIIALFIIFALWGMYLSYDIGYKVGKRSIILNPKGTINDLIKDFKHITPVR